jgi:hypothetical protein
LKRTFADVQSIRRDIVSDRFDALETEDADYHRLIRVDLCKGVAAEAEGASVALRPPPRDRRHPFFYSRCVEIAPGDVRGSPPQPTNFLGGGTSDCLREGGPLHLAAIGPFRPGSVDLGSPASAWPLPPAAPFSRPQGAFGLSSWEKF